MQARRLLLVALLCAVPLAAAAQGRVEHVVVVSIDGLCPAYYLEPDRHGLKVPTLRALVAEGASAEGMRSVFPTLTYPAHTSLVTGVSPRRHGIFLNEAPDPLMKFGMRWYAEQVRARTLYQAAEERGLRAALVFWPVSLGAHANAVFPEFWRGDRDDTQLLRAVSTPGLVAGVEQRFPDFHFDSPAETKDKDLTDIAVHIILTRRPNLLLVHLIQVDHTQHAAGLETLATRAALENADAQLGRIVAALKESGLWEHTVLFVVSDHGFAPVRTEIRPAVLLRRAGLLRLNPQGRVTDWMAGAICSGGTCEVLLKNPADTSTRERVLRIFSALAKHPRNGIERLYSPQETATLSPDPGAFLLLEAAPGFTVSSSAVGVYARRSRIRATHGYNPDRPDQLAAFIVAGPSIKPRRLEEVSILDIAPTVAFLLGLEMPDVEGRTLRELFQPVEQPSPAWPR